MSGSERQQLRALIDARRRELVAASPANGMRVDGQRLPQGKTGCAGCGEPLDQWTPGCSACTDRRRRRAHRLGPAALAAYRAEAYTRMHDGACRAGRLSAERAQQAAGRRRLDGHAA